MQIPYQRKFFPRMNDIWKLSQIKVLLKTFVESRPPLKGWPKEFF